MLQPWVCAAVMALFCTSLAACSPARMGMARIAASLSDTARAYATDDDPELVRLAAPSTLKMVEMLLADQPREEGLLTTACSGFTQYAYAFLQVEAELTPASAAAVAADLRLRAARMYARARGYCWEALQLRHPSLRAAVGKNARAALAVARAADVELLYWLGAAWGGELSLAGNQLLRLPELVSIRAVVARALELNEAWGEGALHEAAIALDGMSPLLGGSMARARQHFDRAVALSGGHSAFAYVALASALGGAEASREEVQTLLRQALAVDPNARPARRLANLIAQKQARAMVSALEIR